MVHIHVTAEIRTPNEFDNLKTFLRADENIETRYNLKAQEDRLAGTDLKLWKVLLPILRIKPSLPSEEFKYVAPIQVCFN
jgi:hypothetical protein